MTLKEVVDAVLENKGFYAVLTLTILQIAPIKIDPWSFIFKWVGKKVNGDLSEKIDKIEKAQEAMEKKLDGLQEDINDVKNDTAMKTANDLRWSILDFFNSSRYSRSHSKEEWDHVLDQMRKYESHVEKYNIDNGVLEEASRWLRTEYQKHINANDFLET